MLEKTILTARLLLRIPQIEDAELIFQSYAQDPEVTRYLIWAPHRSLDETKTFIHGCIQAWEENSRFPWIITKKDTGELLGMIEVRIDDYKAEVGYVLKKSAWGKGYATESSKAVLDTILAIPDIYRIHAFCDIENIASARVMEKAGMTREGLLHRYLWRPHIDLEPRDVFCYAKTK